MPNPTASAIPPITSRSTIFAKLPAEILRQLDQRIVNRPHSRYRAVYDEFRLHEYQVSFTSFYYYARRLRVQTDLLYHAQMALPNMPDLVASLPKFFAYRVLDAVNEERSTPQQLHRLVDSWRVAAKTYIALDRHGALPAPCDGAQNQPEALAREDENQPDPPARVNSNHPDAPARDDGVPSSAASRAGPTSDLLSQSTQLSTLFVPVLPDSTCPPPNPLNPPAACGITDDSPPAARSDTSRPTRPAGLLAPQ